MAFLASLNTLTNGQLLFIGLLIFVAVLIFPHLIRRKNIQRCILEKTKKGEIIRPEDFAGKKQKLFFTHKPLEAQNNCTSVESYQNLIRTRERSPESLDITGFFGFFVLFPLAPVRCFLNRFAYEISLRVLVFFSLFR